MNKAGKVVQTAAVTGGSTQANVSPKTGDATTGEMSAVAGLMAGVFGLTGVYVAKRRRDDAQ